MEVSSNKFFVSTTESGLSTWRRCKPVWHDTVAGSDDPENPARVMVGNARRCFSKADFLQSSTTIRRRKHTGRRKYRADFSTRCANNMGNAILPSNLRRCWVLVRIRSGASPGCEASGCRRWYQSSSCFHSPVPNSVGADWSRMSTRS